MRSFPLSLAVAGVLASAAASAATHDLYIGGATAQLAFFKSDFGTSVCGGSANIQTFAVTNTGTGGNPSNEAWRCAATVATISGIAIGDTVTVHYNSQLGSVSGVAPLVYDNAIAARLFVNPDSTDCPAGVANATVNCTIAGYNQTNETFTPTTAGQQTLQAKTTSGTFHQFDIGASDVEIKHWVNDWNWPDSSFATAFGSVPTAAQLATASSGGVVMNGQVFSVIVNNAGPAAALGNLSKASLEAIFSGKYDVWGDVPEVGAGNTTPIKYCRREYGSGTQVSASIFFTGRECGYSTVALASIVSPGALGTNISEEVSTGNVRTCVAGTTGAIGVASLSTSANYTTLNIDGVQANAHNAANGFYGFTMESWVYNKSAVSGASTAMQNLASSMISNARRSANLTSQAETGVLGANGQYTAATRRANYALPITGLGNTPASVARASTNGPGAVVSLSTKSGDNCKINMQNANTL